MVRIEEINSLSGFLALGHTWNSILEKSKEKDVFSTWEWLSRWWEYLGNNRQLKVLLALEKDEIVGIAPLMTSKFRLAGLGSIRRIEFIGSPDSDYCNFILVRNEEVCLTAFLSYLTQQSDWDWVRLGSVREGSLCARLASTILSTEGSKLDFTVDSLCPYIELPNSIEDFSRKVGRNLRQSSRRTMRRLQERYVVGARTHTDFESIEEAMKMFFGLHEKRWKFEGKSGVFACSALRDFHTAIAKDFDRRGWFLLYFLTADGLPVASNYLFDYEQKRYHYQSGFDPEFPRMYSVGTLCTMQTVELAILKGFREYDFLRGAESYKFHWPTETKKNFKVQLFRNTWIARAYRLMRSLYARGRSRQSTSTEEDGGT
jgi:CelD/BcsL family acetyltransferase involved in cellulose biosynthesis